MMAESRFQRFMGDKASPMLASIVLLLTLMACAAKDAPASKALPPEVSVLNANKGYIDTHNHLFGRFGPRSGSPVLDYEGAAQVALAKMNALGIEKMLIMPPPFPPNHPNKYDMDDFLDVVKKHTDRFGFLGGGGTLNPMIQQVVYDGTTSPEVGQIFEEKALEILSGGALGFGEMTAEHFSMNPRHPYETAPPDHPLFLLLADIAARHDVPIDIHMEAVPEEMALPNNERLRSPRNPKRLRPNIAAFERLLAHNREAKIIWAHAGWCNTGRRTPALMGDLLARHANLYMSIKIGRDSVHENRPLNRYWEIKPEWLNLCIRYPDRFLIGSDHFYLSPRIPRRMPRHAEASKVFLSQLPPEIASKVGYENAISIFKLKKIIQPFYGK